MPYQRPRTAIAARRERIHLQQATTASDGMGGQTVTSWKTVAEPWAAVLPLDERDKEKLDASQVQAVHAYHVDIRYRDGVSPKMRVIWRDKTMQIHTASDDDGRRERLILYCAEVQD